MKARTANNATSTTNALDSAADGIVARLQAIDTAVNALRIRRKQDPETLGDKILLFALPTVAGVIVGHVMQSAWSGVERRSIAKGNTKATTSLAASLARTAVSAAVAAVTNQLSSMGAQAIVRRHHRK